jgi:hypothetical protein
LGIVSGHCPVREDARHGIKKVVGDDEKKSFSANRRQIRISSEAASNSANDLCLNTTGITVAIAMFILIQVSNVIKLFTAVSYDFS